MLLKFFILFAVVIAFKAISNFVKYKRCQKLQSMFYDWIEDKCDTFPQRKSEVINLFKSAGIQDSRIPIVEPAGYGQIRNINASVFHNFPTKIASLATSAYGMFEEAIGVYHLRSLESFNPLYWLETVLFLPKRLLIYVGLDSEKTSFRVSNVLLTFLWWLCGSLLIFFKPQVKEFIFSLLS